MKKYVLLLFAIMFVTCASIEAQTVTYVCYNTSPAPTIIPKSMGNLGTYTLQKSTNNTTWTNVVTSGTTSDLTYNFPAVTSTIYYRIEIRVQIMGNTKYQYSGIMQFSPYTQLISGTNSSTATVCYNTQPYAISCTPATGGNGAISYQWQMSTNNATWADISGANQQNYQPPVLTQTTYFKRKATNECGSVFAGTMTITVRADLNPGTISSDQTLCNGYPPSQMNGTAPTGADGSYSYQWESSNNNSTWSPIGGATSASYSPGSITATTYYRRKVTTSCGSGYSNVVTKTVYAPFAAGSLTGNQTINNGDVPALITGTAATGGNASYTYRWDISGDGISWNTISGANQQNYQPGALFQTMKFRRYVTCNCGGAMTNEITVTVRSSINVGTINYSQVICFNGSAQTITGTQPTGGSGTYTYQWQKSVDNNSWNNISGANSPDYSPGVLSQTTYYRRYVADNAGNSGYSSSVGVTVYNEVNFGTISTNQTICYYTAPTKLVGTTATGGSNNFTYLWEHSNDNVNWSAINHAVEKDYAPSILTQTWYYRRKAINQSCGSGYSNVVIITVRPQFSSNTFGSNQEVCYNATPNQIVGGLPTGGAGSYTYQWMKAEDGNIGQFSPIPLATGQHYTPTALTKTSYFRRVVTDGACGTLENTVLINVRPKMEITTIGNHQTISYNAVPNQLKGTVPMNYTAPITYQWESSTNGTSWSAIPLATSVSHQPEGLKVTTFFKRKLTDACSSYYSKVSNDNSEVITITVLNPLNAGSISTDQTICFNASPSIILGTDATGGTGTLEYQWLQSTNNSTWEKVKDATSKSYSPGALTTTTYFKRRVNDSNYEEAFSNVVTITVNTLLNAGSISSDQSICYNTQPEGIIGSISSGGSGSYTYQWEKSPDEINWIIISGNSPSITPGALTQTTSYRRKTIDSKCGEAYSNVVKITVNPLFSAGTIGSDQRICATQRPVEITGTLPNGGTGTSTYQWESSDTGTSWNTIVNANGQNYTPSLLAKTTFFRRKDVNSCGTSYSNGVTITINAPVTAGTIGNDQSVCYNGRTTVLRSLVAPTGGSGSMSFKWEESIDGFMWNEITGATNETFQKDNVTESLYIRRISNDVCGTATSNEIRLTVYEALTSGVIGEDQTILYNTKPEQINVSEDATGGSGNYTYQWYRSTNGGTTWVAISGARSEVYQPNALTQETMYKRVIKDSSCGEQTSNEVVISIVTEVAVGTIGNDQNLCPGTNAQEIKTITAPLGFVGIVSQRWQSSTDGSTWVNIPGATNASYFPQNLTQTTYFRKVVATASNGEVATNIVTIKVGSPFVIGTIKDNQQVCVNSTPEILSFSTASVGGTGEYTYQWQSSTNGVNFVNINSGVNNYYQPSPISSKTYFRCKVGSSCGEGFTNVVEMSVNPELIPGSISSSQSVSANGTPQVFTAEKATGGSGTYTYQWQKSTDDITWANISNANSESYQAEALNQLTYFRRMVQSGNCAAVSNKVTVNVLSAVVPGVISTDQTIICYNSSANLISGTAPTGGTGSYTYQWQKSTDGRTFENINDQFLEMYQPTEVLQKTYFRRAVTSGGSTVYSNMVMINVTEVVESPLHNAKGVYCKGESAVIKVQNPLYTTYKWFDSLNRLKFTGTEMTIESVSTPATFFIQATDDKGCVSTKTEVTFAVDQVMADFEFDKTKIAVGDPVRFTNLSSGAQKYSWNFNDGELITEVSPWHYYNVGINGEIKNFDVTLTAISKNNCTSEKTIKDAIQVSRSKIDQETVEQDVPDIDIEPTTITIRENPIINKLIIDSNKTITKVVVSSVTGEISTYENQSEINFEKFKSGVYLIEVTVETNKKSIFKVIKK